MNCTDICAWNEGKGWLCNFVEDEFDRATLSTTKTPLEISCTGNESSIYVFTVVHCRS
jgi:hypothetical protein